MVVQLPTPDQFLDELLTLVGLVVAAEMSEQDSQQVQMHELAERKVKAIAMDYGAAHAAMKEAV